MTASSDYYYRRDLAVVHRLGFAHHAEACAPGILRLLEPVLERNGLVVELGCGSGLLTRYLVDAGHRVVATDASPDMLVLAGDLVPDAEAIGRLVLPDDPIPQADAIVGVGHVLNYLSSADTIERALVAIAAALRPRGVLALDLCDLEWGAARVGQADLVRVEDDWALFTRFSTPSPDRYVRELTIFVRSDDGSWHRDDERHDNILVDVNHVSGFLAEHGVLASVASSFGDESLPTGLRAVVGRREA